MRVLPVAIGEDEFFELIRHTLKEHHKVAFLLGFGAGLRISEVVNLQPGHIDLKEHRIFVKQGKGGKDRVVPLPKGFKDKFVNAIPLKCDIRALQKAFRAACKRAGLLQKKPTLHFHSLRHGFATQLARNGMPIHYIRTLMGHSNISTTNVYLEANPEDALKKYAEVF